MCVSIPTDRAHAAASFVGKHSVALLEPEASAASGVRMVGSGTLVLFRGLRYILTATHVWQRLRKHGVIHFTLVRELNHSSKIERAALKDYSLDDIPLRDLTRFSPDLTLLGLNPVDANLIETRLSFMPLEKAFTSRKDELRQEIMMAGAPGVLRKEEWDHLSFEVRGVFADGPIKEESKDELGFITVNPTQEADSPIKDWGGMSGGGLWLISYFPKPEGGIDYDAFLLGVIFFQTGEEIRCHSRKSIALLAQKIPKSK
jgi:hypothetical protein